MNAIKLQKHLWICLFMPLSTLDSNYWLSFYVFIHYKCRRSICLYSDKQQEKDVIIIDGSLRSFCNGWLAKWWRVSAAPRLLR